MWQHQKDTRPGEAIEEEWITPHKKHHHRSHTVSNTGVIIPCTSSKAWRTVVPEDPTVRSSWVPQASPARAETTKPQQRKHTETAGHGDLDQRPDNDSGVLFGLVGRDHRRARRTCGRTNGWTVRACQRLHDLRSEDDKGDQSLSRSWCTSLCRLNC